MILFDNRSECEISQETLDLLNAILASQTSGEVELLLVNAEEIRALNAEFLGRDYASDVLSFPLDAGGFDESAILLGSVVISADKAREMAQKFGHSLEIELAILFTHGLLHILGYDHERDNGEHRAKEREILARFGIDSGLILRAEL